MNERDVRRTQNGLVNELNLLVNELLATIEELEDRLSVLEGNIAEAKKLLAQSGWCDTCADYVSDIVDALDAR